MNTHTLYTTHYLLHLHPSFLCTFGIGGVGVGVGGRALRRAKCQGRAGADLLMVVPVADTRKGLLHISSIFPCPRGVVGWEE